MALSFVPYVYISIVEAFIPQNTSVKFSIYKCYVKFFAWCFLFLLYVFKDISWIGYVEESGQI